MGGDDAGDRSRRCRSGDLMFMCGGGILAHPGGPAAGVASLRQAWRAIRAGQALETRGRRCSGTARRAGVLRPQALTADGRAPAARLVRRRLHRRLGHAGHAGRRRAAGDALPRHPVAAAPRGGRAAGRAGHRRRGARDGCGSDERGAHAGRPLPGVVARAGAALQVLLDLRQLARRGQPGRRRAHPRAGVAQRLRSRRRRPAESRALLRVRQPVRHRGRRRRRASHRPASDDEPASGDADAGGRPAPPPRAAGPRQRRADRPARARRNQRAGARHRGRRGARGQARRRCCST